MTKDNDRGTDASRELSRLEKACEGLVYLSETDAPVVPFQGPAVEEVTTEEILTIAGRDEDEPIEEIAVHDLFRKLRTEHEWFSADQRKNAKRFAALEQLISETLDDIHVYRVGRIRIDIFVAGIDEDGKLAGVRTFAVET